MIKEYIEDGYIIKEYPDGSKEKTLISQGNLGEIITQPQKPSLEQQLEQLRNDNLILMDALATVFEEIMMLREGI